MGMYDFPKDFVFGTATASYQVEGAAYEDGRGLTIWDKFCKEPGRVLNGDSGDVACDHYHRVDEDIQLMKDLGANAYRFSVAWARIFPNGEGEINPKGIDWYSTLVDKLLAAGITPYVTMYHWDLPLALEENYGGWRSRRTPEAFYEYAKLLVKTLGDRVSNWMTLNEMPATIVAGYGAGFHAPGAQESRKVLNQIQHNCLLAHGYGAMAVNELGQPGSEVGTAHNARVYVPVFETPEQIEATRKAFEFDNGPILEPMSRGTYPAVWLERMGEDAPKVDDGDMQIISTPCQFIGLNCYRGIYIEAPGALGDVGALNVAAVENVSLPVAPTPTTSADSTPDDGFVALPFPKSYPRGAAEWVLFVPQALYWGPKFLHESYGYDKLYITENGSVGVDDMIGDRIIDLDRLQYYRLYLQSAARAVAEGIPLVGYFAWSMMDNFEWSDGYKTRFGIHHVDYETLKRTPKMSAKFLAACFREKRVL